MSKYKIIPRSPGWRRFGACTLGVSVMSPNWQDDYFASILDFAAENFKTIRIDVTDLLYRHNFMADGLSPADAAARAEALGAVWLAHHQSLINACPVKPDVIRWSFWSRHSDYPNVLDHFMRVSTESPILRDAIEQDVNDFCQRQGRAPTEIMRQHSRDYLIEEMAIFTLQARALSTLKLYPGNEPHCVHVVRNGLVAEAPRGLEREQYAKVKFHTRGQRAATIDTNSASPVPSYPERTAEPIFSRVTL